MQNFLKRVPIPVFLLVILVSTLGGIFGAIALSPWFSWTGNALSDLGVYGSGSVAATLFNAGLMVGGFTASLLAIKIYGLCDGNHIEHVGASLFLLAGIALFAIGLFPETSPPFHYLASVCFFVLVPFAALFFGLGLIREKNNRSLVILSLIMPLVSIIAWGIPYYDGVAIPEIISSTAGWLWMITIGIYFNKKSN